MLGSMCGGSLVLSCRYGFSQSVRFPGVGWHVIRWNMHLANVCRLFIVPYVRNSVLRGSMQLFKIHLMGLCYPVETTARNLDCITP